LGLRQRRRVRAPSTCDEEVQFCAFDILVEGDDDLRKLPLHLRKTSLQRHLAHRPEGIFANPFERGEIGPDLFRAACRMGLEGLVSNIAIGPIRPAGPSTGSTGRIGVNGRGCPAKGKPASVEAAQP
jgi:ATP-dependent DNA ligase